MSRLKGEKILITGAARRIGHALALALAEAGANAAITYRNSRDEANATVAEMRAFGTDAFALHCELTEPDSITSAVELAAQALGGLTMLINNAGSFETAGIEQLSVSRWDAMFATNTRAPFLGAQAALPHLRLSAEERTTASRILNIGSLGGQHAWTTHAHYCASKAALHMLTLTMAKAFAPEVAVNCVAPGMIVTGNAAPEYAHFVGKTPMQRNGTPADVVEAVLFFASATSFITGQVLTVDGGLGL